MRYSTVSVDEIEDELAADALEQIDVFIETDRVVAIHIGKLRIVADPDNRGELVVMKRDE
jgi:hypothetical protein